MDAWEFRDLTIPLGLRNGDRDLERRYYAIVLANLRKAGEDGWQAAVPIDLGSRLKDGAVRTHEQGVRPTSWGSTTYESVTIRLKRRTS